MFVTKRGEQMIDHVAVSMVTGGMWNDSDEEGEAV